MMPPSSAAPRPSTIPDHVSIVIHNYRWRLGLAEGEPQYDDVGKAARRRSGHQRTHHYA